MSVVPATGLRPRTRVFVSVGLAAGVRERGFDAAAKSRRPSIGTCASIDRLRTQAAAINRSVSTSDGHAAAGLRIRPAATRLGWGARRHPRQGAPQRRRASLARCPVEHYKHAPVAKPGHLNRANTRNANTSVAGYDQYAHCLVHGWRGLCGIELAADRQPPLVRPHQPLKLV